ncbi:hypothetical protein [Pseudooctadecabacter sp.]|uniref:hypothetical protein n=1 Tax=Pseudooctadecabacter sp. TaxID=1966338 RepID=UPI0035C7D100
MTAALWLVLLTVVTPLSACVVLGLIYLGLGCISFAAAAMTGKSHDVDSYKAADAPKTGVNAPRWLRRFCMVCKQALTLPTTIVVTDTSRQST